MGTCRRITSEKCHLRPSWLSRRHGKTNLNANSDLAEMHLFVTDMDEFFVVNNTIFLYNKQSQHTLKNVKIPKIKLNLFITLQNVN